MDSDFINQSSLAQTSQKNSLAGDRRLSETADARASGASAHSQESLVGAGISSEIATGSQPKALGQMTHHTADRLHQAAASMRDRGARFTQGALAEKLATQTASVMDHAAHYLEETSAKSIPQALTDQIRRHPWVTIGLGVTVGVWLGRALKR